MNEVDALIEANFLKVDKDHIQNQYQLPENEVLQCPEPNNDLDQDFEDIPF